MCQPLWQHRRPIVKQALCFGKCSYGSEAVRGPSGWTTGHVAGLRIGDEGTGEGELQWEQNGRQQQTKGVCVGIMRAVQSGSEGGPSGDPHVGALRPAPSTRLLSGQLQRSQSQGGW